MGLHLHLIYACVFASAAWVDFGMKAVVSGGWVFIGEMSNLKIRKPNYHEAYRFYSCTTTFCWPVATGKRSREVKRQGRDH